jgi:hypothetical protein
MKAPPSKAALPSAVPSSALKALAAALLLMLGLTAQAEVAGVITHLSGTLITQPADGASRVLSVNSEVHEGESLATQDKTFARIKFKDGGEIVLRPNSQLAVNRYAYKPAEPVTDNFAVGLVKGGMRMVTGLLGKRNPERVNVVTPTATVGIRGTHFGLLMCQGDCAGIPTVSGQTPAEGLHIDVADGAIQVTNPAGQQLLSAGQFGYVRSVATPPVAVPPGQGIQVTMPPNISQNNAAGRSVGVEAGAAECVAQ